MGRNLVRAINGTEWRCLYKVNNWLPYDPAGPLLGLKPKMTEMERHRQANVHCSSITIVKTWKQPKIPSTDEWTKKNWYMHRPNISQGKKWHNAICNTVDESRSNHTTCRKSESERHIYYDITYRCHLKLDTSEDISTEKGNHRFIKQTYDSPMERCEDWIH